MRRKSMPLPLVALLAGLTCSTSTRSEAADALRESESERTAGIEPRVDPLVDLYFFVRAQAADRDADPQPGYEAGVEAARVVQEMLDRFGASSKSSIHGPASRP